MSIARCSVGLAVLGLLAFLSPAAGGDAVTLDQLMGALRTVRQVDSRYIERRTLHALRTPIETRGSLHFDAPGHLEKRSDPDGNGQSERLLIDGDRLTIDRGKAGSPIVLSLRDHPEIAVLVESIRATLAGDADALRRVFDVTTAGTPDEWQMTLVPRDAAQRDLLQWMKVSGYGRRITTIDTQDGEGDRSEMSIVELRP